jgi:hypothetical protein
MITAACVARSFGATWPDRVFLFLLAASAELGALVTLLSFGHHLTAVNLVASQAALGLGSCLLLRRRPGIAWPSLRFTRIEWLILAWIAALLTLSLLQQILVPAIVGDARSYHASRAAYWMQFQSVFPYPTHNDRQIAFSFGSDIWFFYGLLLSKSEAVARCVHWLAYPSSVLSVALVSRRLGASRTASLGAALLFAAAPIAVAESHGLHPDIAAAPYLCAVLFFWTSRRPWSALAAAFATSVKSYCAPLLLVTLFSAPLATVAGVAASGAAIPTIAGSLSAPVVATHRAEVSPYQLWTHAVRLPFALFELPWMPSPAARAALTSAGNRAYNALAPRPLPLEAEGDWPGRFYFRVPEYARYYSLGAFAFFALLLRRNFATNLTLALTAAIVFGVRWMDGASVPLRFLIGPYAMAVCCCAAYCRVRRERALVALLAVCVIPSGGLTLRAWQGITSPPQLEGEGRRDWGSVLDRLPPGSRVLLFSQPNSADYDLFFPKLGFPNHVVPWGNAAFDAARLDALLGRERITHVVMPRSEALEFGWHPRVALAPFEERCKNKGIPVLRPRD